MKLELDEEFFDYLLTCLGRATTSNFDVNESLSFEVDLVPSRAEYKCVVSTVDRIEGNLLFTFSQIDGDEIKQATPPNPVLSTSIVLGKLPKFGLQEVWMFKFLKEHLEGVEFTLIVDDLDSIKPCSDMLSNHPGTCTGRILASGPDMSANPSAHIFSITDSVSFFAEDKLEG